MDFTGMTDDELDTTRVSVLNEQERRHRIISAPLQAADIARRFVEDGGTLATLASAVTTALDPAPVVEEPVVEDEVSGNPEEPEPSGD